MKKLISQSLARSRVAEMCSTILRSIHTMLFGTKTESADEYYNDHFSPAVRNALAGAGPRSRRRNMYHQSQRSYLYPVAPVTRPYHQSQRSDPDPVVPVMQPGLSSLAACVAECAICQEVGRGAASRINTCGHVYHTACLSPWLVTNSTCPMCRATV